MKKFNDRLPFCLQLFADETSGETEGIETKILNQQILNQLKDKTTKKKTKHLKEVFR